MTFQLFYHVAEMDSLGYLEPYPFRIMFPAFKLSVPEMKSASPKSPISLRYPSTAYRESAEGKATLFFFVDKYGKPEAESIHDNWPEGRPRQTGALGKSYDAFVKAARGAILSTEFVPATIAGCAVRQMVAQPFQFLFTNR